MAAKRVQNPLPANSTVMCKKDLKQLNTKPRKEVCNEKLCHCFNFCSIAFWVRHYVLWVN
mgnify:CR=1 FL=1